MPYSSLTLARRMALMKALRAKSRSFKRSAVSLGSAARTYQARGITTGLYRGGSVAVAPTEVKFFDSVFPTAGIPAGPASLIDPTIVNMVNGTGPNDRIGRRVKVLKIDYSFSVVCGGAGLGLSSDAFRFDLWLDKQSNGAAPGPADLYTTAAVPGTAQMVNVLNEKRFKRLYSKVQSVNSQNAAGIGAVTTDIRYKFEGSIYPKVVLEYDASTGNITDLTSSNLFTSWSCDNGLCTVLAVFTRVHFVDA